MEKKIFELFNQYGRELAEEFRTGCKLMIKSGNKIFETADGADLAQLKPEDVIKTAGGSTYPIEHEILKQRGDTGALVISETPYCMMMASAGETLTAVLDDMAQIVGTEVQTVAYERRAVEQALSTSESCFIKGGKDGKGDYTVTLGRSLFEAITALAVLEKSAEVNLKARVLGGARCIEKEEACRMRINYLNNYSKAEAQAKAEEERRTHGQE